MKYPKLFTSLIAAAVLCTPGFTVPAAMPASDKPRVKKKETVVKDRR